MPSPLFTSPLSIRFEQLNSFTWPLCTLNLNSIDFFYDGKRASSATPKNIKKNTKKSRKKLNKEKKPKNVPRELLTYRSKGELVPPLVFWNSGANPGWSYAPDFCHLPGNFNGHFFAVCCRCCCGCCRCCCCCY